MEFRQRLLNDGHPVPPVVLGNLQEIYRGRVSLVASAACTVTGRSVVLKAYIKSKLTAGLREMVHREVKLHARCNRVPGVAELLGWFEDDVQIVLVMEHCAGGDLYRELVLKGGQMAEEQAVQNILVPLMRVLSELHAKGISHRDLKPENLFFSVEPGGGRRLRVGDFGLASDLKEMRDRVGTLDYMAPEVSRLLLLPLLDMSEHDGILCIVCGASTFPRLDGLRAQVILQRDESHFQIHAKDDDSDSPPAEAPAKTPIAAYTCKVDVWAVGAIAYELLVGRPPFEVADPTKTAMLIVWGDLRVPEGMISPGAEAFVRAALTKDPKKRPRVEELLQGPWITALRAPDESSWMALAERTTSADGTPSLDDGALPQLQTGQGMQRAKSGGTFLKRAPPSKSKTMRTLCTEVKPLSASQPLPMLGPKPVTQSHRQVQLPAHVQHEPEAAPEGPPVSGNTAALMMGEAAKARRRRRSSQTSGCSEEEFGIRTQRPSLLRRGSNTEDGPPLGFSSDSTHRNTSAQSQTSTGSLPDTPTPSSRSPSRSASRILRRLSSMLGLSGCLAPPSPKWEVEPAAEIGSPHASDGSAKGGTPPIAAGTAPATPRQPHESQRQASQSSNGGTSVATSSSRPGVPRSSRGISETSAAGSDTNTRRSRRAVKRVASRIGLGVSRLVTRVFDNDAPWNTGGGTLRGIGSLAQPGDAELEAIHAENGGRTERKRFMEYMLRRGGDAVPLKDDLGKLSGGQSSGGGKGQGTAEGGESAAPAAAQGGEASGGKARRRRPARHSATYSNLMHVVQGSARPLMQTEQEQVAAALGGLSVTPA